MMMIMMGGGWSSREAERDSRERERERDRGKRGVEAGAEERGLLLSVAVLKSRGGKALRDNMSNDLDHAYWTELEVAFRAYCKALASCFDVAVV